MTAIKVLLSDEGRSESLDSGYAAAMKGS
jgi:hypothetical protein